MKRYNVDIEFQIPDNKAKGERDERKNKYLYE